MKVKKDLVKLTKLILVVAVILSGIRIMKNFTLDVEAEESGFAGGDGSKEYPYQIATAEQLNNIRNNLDESIYFELIDDIDLTKFIEKNNNRYGWVPIGDSSTPFNGHFNGLGFKITGLWIDRQDDDNVGLFGHVASSCSIKNLGVELNDKGVNGGYDVGGLVGWNNGGTIINSYVKGNVRGSNQVGCLVGWHFGGTILNSYAIGNVHGISYVGGLAGENNSGTITYSYATGMVEGEDNVGGFVGSNYYGKIENCYTTGSVHGNSYIGGFVGWNIAGTITYGYATGYIEGEETVGGFIGCNDNESRITKSYFDKNSTRKDNDIGRDEGIETDISSLSTAEMIASDTLEVSMSDLENGVWKKREKTNDSYYYPELAFFYDDGELDTQIKKDSEKSVRAKKVELKDGTITPSTKEIIYGTSLGDIKTEHTYKTNELEIKGYIRWNDGDETILNVSESGSKHIGTFVPNDDLYESVEDVSITIDVIPKEITIIPDANQSKEYGVIDPVLSFTLSDSLIASDQIEQGTLVRQSGESIGWYKYEIDKLKVSQNYKLLLDNIEAFEITKATPSILLKATPTEGSQDENNVSLSILVTNRNTSITTDNPTGDATVYIDNNEINRYKLDNDSSISIQLTLNPGNHDIEVRYNGDENYVTGDQSIIYNVAKINQKEITIEIPESIFYGDSFLLTTTGGSGEGETTWEIIEGNEYAMIDSKTGEVTIIGVGTITVKATKAKDDTYNEAYTEVTFISNKKEVSITGMIVNSREYDGTTDVTIHSIGTIDGLLPSDQGNVSIASTFTATFEDKKIGENKTVSINNLSLTGEKADNYTLNSSSLDMTATIYPRKLSIIGITVASKTYDGTTTATVSDQGTLEGLIVNDEVTIGSISVSFIDANVGENKPTEIKAKIIGNDSANYTIVAPTDVQASITPKGLMVTPDANQFKYYGQKTDPVLTYKVTGVIEGERIDFTGSLEREQGEEKESYKIDQGTLASTNNNYTINFISGVVFTIQEYTPLEEAFINGTLGDNNWYTSVTSLETPDGFEISSIQEGNYTSSIIIDSQDGKNKTVTYYLKNKQTGAISEAKTISYQVDATAPEATIKIKTNQFKEFIKTISFHLFYKKSVDVTITATDIISKINTIEYQIVKDEESYDPDGTWTTASSFSIKANQAANVYAKVTDKAGNTTIINSEGVVVYTDTQVKTTSLEYTKTTNQDVIIETNLNGNNVKEISINGTTLTNQEDYAVNNEIGIITLESNYLETLLAGDYTVTITYNPLGYEYQEVADNQEPEITNIPLMIHRAEQEEITIIDIPNTITYGDENFTLKTSGGSGEGETTWEIIEGYEYATIDSKTGEVTINKAGTITVLVTKEADDTYNQTESTIKIKINKKELIVTTNTTTRLYGEENPEFNIYITGFIQGEDESNLVSIPSASTTAASTSETGEYPITISGGGAENYYFTYLDGILTIKANTKELEKLIEEAKVIEKEQYTEESWNTLEETIKEANVMIEKENVSQKEIEETIKRLKEAIESLQVQYYFINDFPIFKGKSNVSATTNGKFNKFNKLLIDGKEIDKSNYTIEKDFMVITIKESYLTTLKNGNYQITVIFTDGSVSTNLTIDVGKTSTSKTKDNQNIQSWIALLSISLLSMIIIKRNKEKET